MQASPVPELPAHDADLDARGLLCPLPVLKARKRLAALASGQVLRMLATDPAAVIDVPHFCAEAGHDLLGAVSEGEAVAYFIRRA
jgi:tRNA 2-thiouridine synthesizing protein A